MILPDIPNFTSLFKFDQRVSTLETEMSEFKQTNQFAEAVSSILGIVDKYLASKMKEAVDSKSKSSSKGASRSQPKSSGKSAQAEEHRQQVDDLEEHLHQEFKTRDDDVIPVREKLEDASQWNLPSTQSSFNEFLATPIDFSTFIMNRLKIDNLTQQVLTGLTYDLIKGMFKSVVELEYRLEEVFKATNDRLDWHNLEGKPYPYDLSKPLPLIQNERGRQVIPWDYFINNDLKYLKGGSSSQKYTTSVTKTKAADYGQVKWIEDKVSRIWSPIIVRRQDDQLYKFREDDFKRLRRQDIEDMLLLLVQYKLSNLNLEEWQRARVMIKATDKKLRDRRLMRNLEKFVGGRPYEGDLRLLERTIRFII
ncbi:hypothetical protein Tco_0847890 [Tanacetum coccineum]